MHWKDREDIQVIETLKKVVLHFQNLILDEMGAEDEETPAWEERLESKEQMISAVECAADFISDTYRGRKQDAVLVHESIMPTDNVSYAGEISRMKKNSRLDVFCPVCGHVTRAVEPKELRGTIFCWNCGQPMTAYVGKMYDVLRHRCERQEGGGADGSE